MRWRGNSRYPLYTCFSCKFKRRKPALRNRGLGGGRNLPLTMNSVAANPLIGQTASMLRSTRTKFLNLLMCLCLPALPITCLAQPAQQDSTGNLAALLQRQVGWDDALPDKKNPSGLHFKFLKIDEASTPEGHQVRYRVYVPGASEKPKYALGTWKIGSDLQILPVDVYVNAQGLLMVHKPRPDQENSDSVADDDELDLATPAARGEPVRFVLATPDGKFMVPGTVVPFPIESKGSTCRIEVRLVEPEGQAILIYADGLPPNSEIPFQAVSAGEPETSKFSVNANGHAVTTDLPYVDGKAMGILKVTVDAKGCLTSVEIPWGKGTYHPL